MQRLQSPGELRILAVDRQEVLLEAIQVDEQEVRFGREVPQAEQRAGRLEDHADGHRWLETLAGAAQLQALLEQDLAHAPEIGLIEYLYIESEGEVGKDIPLPKKGTIQIPDAPGLGFEPDFDAIDRFRVG